MKNIKGRRISAAIHDNLEKNLEKRSGQNMLYYKLRPLKK